MAAENGDGAGGNEATTRLVRDAPGTAAREGAPLNDLLQLAGEGSGAGRATLLEAGGGGLVLEATHEWCAPGVPSARRPNRQLAIHRLPWAGERLRTGTEIVLPESAALPAAARLERRLLARRGAAAVLAFPLLSRAGDLLGALHLEVLSDRREWSADELATSRRVARVATSELERRRAESRARAAAERMRRTERLAGIGGWEFEPDTGATWWSDGARGVLGLPAAPGPVTLFDFFQRIHPEDRDRVRAAALEILDGGGEFRCPCRTMPLGGSAGRLEIHGTLREVDGHRLVVGTVHRVPPDPAAGEPGPPPPRVVHAPLDAPVGGVRRGMRSDPAPASPTVLVVEDDPTVTDTARRILQRAGFEVFASRDPAEALELRETRQQGFSLLITDVVMPGIGGPELARRIRARDPDTPVVFMSGHPPEVAREMGVEDGAVFLSKPFTADRLLERVHRVLALDSST